MYPAKILRLTLHQHMQKDLAHSLQKKSKDHQKQYKQFLTRADKNEVLKQLLASIMKPFSKINCLNAQPVVRTIRRVSKHRHKNVSAGI
jgi:hypothetical protein